MPIKISSELSLSRSLNTLLEGAYWLSALAPKTLYSRVHDDCEGDLTQTLGVMVGGDGDVHVLLPNFKSLRFRTWGGGGLSLRTRNALLVLAEAIRRDNETLPIRPAEDVVTNAQRENQHQVAHHKVAEWLAKVAPEHYDAFLTHFK